MFALQVPKEYEEMYSHVQDPNRRIYSGMMTALDDAVGNITAALEATGLIDNLLLVFNDPSETTDIADSHPDVVSRMKAEIQRPETNHEISPVHWYPKVVTVSKLAHNIPSLTGYTTALKESTLHIFVEIRNASVRFGEKSAIYCLFSEYVTQKLSGSGSSLQPPA
nr:hypothetical protein BaRGS_034525 [Batillaria attramentaria]